MFVWERIKNILGLYVGKFLDLKVTQLKLAKPLRENIGDNLFCSLLFLTCFLQPLSSGSFRIMRKTLKKSVTVGAVVSDRKTYIQKIWKSLFLTVTKIFISCFPVGYREILVKIFFDLILVPPVKIHVPIFMFLLPRLIARALQPDGNMTSFNLHFWDWNNIVMHCYII